MRKHGLSFESVSDTIFLNAACMAVCLLPWHEALAALQVPSDEQSEFSKELQRMCDIMMKQDRVQMSPADFVKVPFLQALELVSHRRVFVQNGIAYVPRDRLMTIIITRFRASVSTARCRWLPLGLTRFISLCAQLSRGLAFAYKALPTILRDERLGGKLL